MSQLEENIDCIKLLSRWTKELDDKINSILENNPEEDMDFRNWIPRSNRRDLVLVSK